jgi:hypothetical protein
MLTFEFYRDANTMFPGTSYFDNTYEDEWLITDFAKRAVRHVDKSEIIGPNLIESSVLGPIPPSSLSGGVKSLILAYNEPEKRKYSSLMFGDNCTGFILEAARDKNITVVIEHPLKLPEDMTDTVYFKELDKYVNTYDDYIHTMLRNHATPWGGPRNE